MTERVRLHSLERKVLVVDTVVPLHEHNAMNEDPLWNREHAPACEAYE